jgi:hypothetical protein
LDSELKKLVADLLMKIFPNFYFTDFWSALLLKHLKPTTYIELWSTQPFNGQIQRANQIRRIADEFKPTVCIETGTYFGTSTPHLASLVSGKTFTIEIDPMIFQKAQDRLSRNFQMYDINCILGDSATELEKLLQKLDPTKERVLAYLDAHWLDALPLMRELELLAMWGGDWIAVVDDFMVPNDNGYGYDGYENNIIGKSQVPINLDLEIYVPNGLSQLETGARRGTGYIFNNKLRSRFSERVFSELQIV